VLQSANLTKENSCVSYWIFHATDLGATISVFHNLKPTSLIQSLIYVHGNVIRHALEECKPVNLLLYEQQKNIYLRINLNTD